jgi:hypothetical protein
MKVIHSGVPKLIPVHKHHTMDKYMKLCNKDLRPQSHYIHGDKEEKNSNATARNVSLAV